MMKRELERLTDAAVDVDAPRLKRRKEKEEIQDEPDVVMGESNTKVIQDGTRLWDVIRTHAKDGRILSNDFYKLPSKRQYPDYYQHTKNPVSLEDVKNRLNSQQYSSLDAVKLDLETCFRNAKKYNQRESQIWHDAKALHKLVSKEYNKMTGAMDDTRVDVENDGDDNVAGSDDDGGKKKKSHNLTRMLRSRLQKLVDKTDDSGRVMASEFMDLPNKKLWPVYYKAIKRPQCFENIFKHLKRKEYHNAIEFSKDVELVFSNAMEFNAENSQIYEDARALKDYFHQLMSDLPTQRALPEASGSKLMLKVPAAAPNPPAAVTPAQAQATPVKQSNSVTLRVPSHHQPTTESQPQLQTFPSSYNTPAAPANATPAPTTRTSTQIITHQLTPTTTYVPSSHYPNVAYQQHPVRSPAPLTTMHAPSPIPYNDIHTNAYSHNLTKTPDPSPTRNFRCMVLTTKPQARKLELDHREGVKVWAVRLGKNETSLSLSSVRFLTSSTEEDEDTEDKRESDQEEEEEEEEETPEVRTRGRPRKKGKGKAPPKVTKPVKKQKPNPPEDEIVVRLNGTAITDSSREWNVEVPLGPSILEVSEKGGAIWKLYLDRI